MGRTFDEKRVEAAFDSAMRQAERYMDDAERMAFRLGAAWVADRLIDNEDKPAGRLTVTGVDATIDEDGPRIRIESKAMILSIGADELETLLTHTGADTLNGLVGRTIRVRNGANNQVDILDDRDKPVRARLERDLDPWTLEPDPPRDRVGPHTTRIRSQRHDDPWAHPLPGGDA